MVVSNIFYFHPYLGKWSILTNIFQMGCFNHQLVDDGLEMAFQEPFVFFAKLRYVVIFNWRLSSKVSPSLQVFDLLKGTGMLKLPFFWSHPKKPCCKKNGSFVCPFITGKKSTLLTGPPSSCQGSTVQWGGIIWDTFPPRIATLSEGRAPKMVGSKTSW